MIEPGSPSLRRAPLRLAALALGALLASCGGLKSSALPEQSYLLRAAGPPALAPGEAAPARLPVWVQVARPLAEPGLESERIMVVRSDRRLDGYTAARWAGPVPEVVAALAVETLRSSGRFAGVLDDRAPLAADYELRMTVRHFEADYANEAVPPRAEVAFDCVAVRRSDRVPVASFSAQAHAEAATNRLGAVVEAFERATREALGLVQAGLASAIAADAAAPLRTTTAPSPP